ncbi:MAG: DUF1848 domain-containing protein [Treponema sp.]|jgi:hypothetical protein|nr:DUF1848 domain-containing protein [Treponema sp.]
MIISASRRTDIPAFYGEWFVNRIREGEVWVRNPMNPKSISKISLDPAYVECIVFWTKNPANFIPYLEKIEKAGHRYYFQFTLNPYDDDIEPNIDKNKAVETFITLSKLIGREKVIWRYDPIIVNSKYTAAYHSSSFRTLCEKLAAYTEKCVISFVDNYSFLSGVFKESGIKELDDSQIEEIANSISVIAKEYGVPLAACSEKIDLAKYGIGANKCVDNELINRLFNLNIKYKKDPGQRPACACAAGRDIGSYNTCGHNCVYCYAMRGKRGALPAGDPASPLLC